MSSRTEGLDELIRDLGQAPAKALPKIKKVMRRSGVEIKKRMQSDMRGSSSFKAVARSIDFDDLDASGFGARSIRVEVGPNASRDPSAALAGIAYFGGSRGGGGTVPDPRGALESEAESAVKFIEQTIRDVL